MLALLKSNPNNPVFIQHIKEVETAKKELELSMSEQNIFDSLCLKLIH